MESNINYDSTMEFWDNIFQKENQYDVSSKLKYPQIDKALEWLSSEDRILDYGCGNGRMLFRTLLSGKVKKALGIDLSISGINLASKIAQKNNLDGIISFVKGDISYLSTLGDKTFSGCILSNVFDNMTPKDGRELLKEIHRILVPHGKILLKLNPYIEEEKQKEYGFIEIEPNFFKEQSGLFLHNLKKEELERIFSGYFTTERYEECYFKEYDMINRMFYLINRNGN